jgi:hypothetical protein
MNLKGWAAFIESRLSLMILFIIFVTKTCLSKLCMVLITPLNFGGLTCDRFFYFELWEPFCAVKQNMPAMCTTRDGTVYSREVSLKSNQQL